MDDLTKSQEAAEVNTEKGVATDDYLPVEDNQTEEGKDAGKENQPPEKSDAKPNKQQEIEAVDEMGVPWKNRAKEYERKYREMLEKQITERLNPPPAPQPDETEEIVAALKEVGYDDRSIEAIRKLTIAEARKLVTPVFRTASLAARDRIIDRLKLEDKIGAFEKLNSEIMEEIESLPVEYQSNEEVIRTAVSRAVYKNLSKLMAGKSAAEPTKKIVTPPVETVPTPKKNADSVDYSDEDVERYILQGIDPKRARELVIRERKLAEKRNNK